jgi:hypothetical protein
MRPVEMIVGKPVGAIEVRWGVNNADGAYGLVECYNGMTKKSTFLKVDGLTAVGIDNWIRAGKPGNIQDVFPNLTPEQREQMISGITPEEWDNMFSEDEGK